jgi:hypothetical protein
MVKFSITGDVKMIPYILETSLQVTLSKLLYGEGTIAARRAAMNYQEAYLPIILIETSRRHNEQALMPSAPAMALATAMITLRSTPQTDFFSFFCSMMRFMIYDLKSMGQGPALRFSLAFNCQLSIA